MFNNPAYQTAHYEEVIPEEVKRLLWSIIQGLKEKDAKEVDYLQIFKLSNNCEGLQIIERSQEKPPENVFYYLPTNGETICGKVFVIDDEDHHTYLMAEDY